MKVGASFRCNEFGHLCGGVRPPRTPANGAQPLSGTFVSVTALSLLVLALAACSSSKGTATPDLPGTRTFTFQSTLDRDVDVLFMIDNSVGAKDEQVKTALAFPAFVDTLAALPGGLPNLHIAVVSSDMGAGPFGEPDLPRCHYGGDEGEFQTSPRDPAACAKGSLNPGESFVIDGNVPSAGNHVGKLADVLACVAQLGTDGCSFEHPLASVLRALGADGQPPPAKNVDFLRPQASLMIVFVTDEDDCSAPRDTKLFDPASRLVSDELGPLSSFRCNEYGHLCGGRKPPRAPANPPADLGTCTSAEDGVLLRIGDAVSRLKGLKSDPSKVMAAAIAGPPAPYVVELVPPTLKDDLTPWPSIRHSCTAPSGSFADPAVRIKQWVDGFGANGVFQAACNDSYAPAMQQIAQQIGKALGENCLDAGIDPTTCTFTDEERAVDGTRTDTLLRACASNGDRAPCWSAEPSPRCGAGRLVTFKRTGAPTGDLSTLARCPID